MTYQTSTDGVSFITRTLPATIYGGASNGSGFVFHAQNGTVYTSSDGITLVSRGSQGAISYYNSVAFGSNMFALISSTSAAKISTDNGVNWIQKTLPETINWCGILFDTNNMVFIIVATNVNYAYKTTDFNLFSKIDLPFTLPSYPWQVKIGMIDNYTVLNGYLSQNLKSWIKPNITTLYLNAVKNPPTYVIGNASGSTINTYELKSNVFYSPPNPTNATNINAFVRTALG